MKTATILKQEISLIERHKKVAVGLSGGVDSAVSAVLLKQAGYDVIGVNMKCWSNEDGSECQADRDRKIAVQVAEFLEIPIQIWDFEKEYRGKVIDYFYSEFERGRTPNPDVICNKEIKFKLFMEKALKNLKVDYVATGHYARILRDNGVYRLLTGVDESKDQSYFLYTANQDSLRKTLFPLGYLTKQETREIAKEYRLPNADKPDSQGICFVGEVNLKDFLMKRLKPKKGDVVNLNGEVIGSHDGVWFYTVGQRRGFDIRKYQGKPMYVVDKDVKQNRLIVGDIPDVNTDTFKVEIPIHYVFDDARGIISSDVVDVRIRHLGERYKARVLEDGKVLGTEKNFQSVASGQSAVFYQGDEVLGGGVIL